MIKKKKALVNTQDSRTNSQESQINTQDDRQRSSESTAAAKMKLAEIFKKYFGDNLIAGVKMIAIANVIPGNWRQIRLDGVQRIRNSIKKNGVVKLSYWL